MNTSLWECKKVTFLDFWGKFKIWPFWPIFGQKWPILTKMAYFGYFSKTAHQILIIFCIKLSDIVRNWKLLDSVLWENSCFGNFGHFWQFFGQFWSPGGEKNFLELLLFFFLAKIEIIWFWTKKKNFVTQPPCEALPPDLVKILTKN